MEIKESKETKRKKIKIGYGVKVPTISFEEAIEILEKTGQSIGFDGSLDDLSRMAGNTPTSSTFIKKLAAMKNYNLLSVSGDKFAITDLGQKIVNPTSPEQRAYALLESFLNLDIFKAIYETYKGKLLPERTFLGNFINKELDIPYQLKKDWADYFYKAAEFVEILHRREGGSVQVMGRPSLVIDETSSAEIPQKSEKMISPQEPPSIKQQESGQDYRKGGIIETSQWGILNQRKVSDGRKAIFAIPDELTKEDVEAIKKILGGIESSLDGLMITESENNKS